jgi:predicted signal transduction protein with EAL and GGDEF domain
MRHWHAVAEGSEHAAQLDERREPGCSPGQGYLLARSVSAEVIRQLLDQPTARDAGGVSASDTPPDPGGQAEEPA